MRILYMGNKNRGVVCLQALLDHGEDIVGVVAPPDFKIEPWYKSLKEFAIEKGLPVLQPANVNSSKFVQKVRNINPDLIVLAGYNQIIRKNIIEIPEKGVLNLHGGKLPEYRGASTLNWMIINGETEGGVAIIFVDEDIDTGGIVLQKHFEIKLQDTINDVVDKTDQIFPHLLIEAIEKIESNTAQVIPQHLEEGTYYHSRRPRDGEIDWNRYSAKQVYDLVRALTHPYPGAFTYFDGKKLFIWKTSLLKEDIRGIPGRVCRRRSGGVAVVAVDRALLVESVQLESGNECNANDFFRKLGVDLRSSINNILLYRNY